MTLSTPILAGARTAARPVAFAPALVVPTLDNARTLPRVLDGLRRLSLPIVVVDDGSTDDTPRVLERWRSDSSELSLERHAVNRGKAAALRTGFAAAAELGATHAVSIDADGQHDPSDIPALLELARARPGALVLGVREDRIPGCPPRCLLGRRVANALVRVESGVRTADCQCGLRVYPLDLVRAVPCRAERFGFETEVVVRAAWAGREVVEAPVSCVYEVPGGRVSHWRPVVDTLRDARLHARLLGAAARRGIGRPVPATPPAATPRPAHHEPA